ncbi:hypothetical protein Peur_033489 [Populus x canadensis]
MSSRLFSMIHASYDSWIWILPLLTTSYLPLLKIEIGLDLQLASQALPVIYNYRNSLLQPPTRQPITSSQLPKLEAITCIGDHAIIIHVYERYTLSQITPLFPA